MAPDLATNPTPVPRQGRARKTPREAIAVVNGRASGADDAVRLRDAVVTALREAGAASDGFITHSQREFLSLLGEAGESRVVLVGGDGTLHAAANSPGPLPELALVPAGRANNVARALGIPSRLRDSARIAASASARPLDVLRVESNGESRRCVEALSAGLQAEARAAYSADNSADLGAGVSALASALRRYRPYRISLRGDGELLHEGEAAQVFLSNLPYFGFGFAVNPAARGADGLLEAIVLRAGSRVDAVRLLLAAYRGRHLDGGRGALHRVHHATLAAPVPLACDATPLGVGTASVSVEPGRLRLGAPWRH